MKPLYLFALSFSLLAQDNGLAVVRTLGLYDTDGSVLYSAYVASKNAKLGSVAVGSTVPLGARFIEVVDAPSGAVFEGVRDNVAVWSAAEIAEDRLIGPFTFRAKPDGAAPLVAEQPAAVSFQSPEAALISYNGTDRPLVQPEDSGSVTFDQRGTIDASGKNGPVPVGKTGVLLLVREGAVRTQTTIAFERRRVVNANLPNEEDTWWCAQYQISISPQENAPSGAGISFILPTRRALPAGLKVSAFAHVNGNEWKKYASTSPQPEFGFNGGFGCATLGFNNIVCGGGSNCTGFNCGFNGGLGFGFGVSNTLRQSGSVTGSQITSTTGTTTTAASSIRDGTSNITDGTSNIIAILIGFRP